ncbi:glycogen synthase GlgA [Cytobacillus oceanisediminis]|uniref:Glycogen synthase n=2 Tax=Niallia TaxID=2837506 RepID=A0A941JJI7_NIACI|nr:MULTISPECIES: glycogen synthase GlgA [Bacillaceae]MBQ6446688.1 glycogen synthase GlgA [Bacillus sp. (in: firmicutes)]MDU1846735.1 glycogen synthase GlgA [Niallia nealsonii]MBZ9535716.1 glycogen synthase GlgA [Cytobacillus oceanisediminis]MCB5238467.1 glycogen synthase GlgA [Niallia circulans]NMO78897.1 glycogen synthase GlgA [Niallia alba]
MRVLFAVSECVPFIKSGGLADVAGSLPKELKKQGTDVAVIMPKYQDIPAHLLANIKKRCYFFVPIGWRNQYCGIEELEVDGITFYFIDNEWYFKRSGLYGYGDDGERFAFFNRAVLESLPYLADYPDIIHCHDWHTAMIPFLLNVDYKWKKEYSNIKTVFTIHNLQFQGILPREVLGDLFNLNDYYFTADNLEFYGNVNLMKGGLIATDKITTVSPTYKNEIQTEYYGEKLNNVLKQRESDLYGIINGIDEETYNPETDPGITANYTVTSLEKKQENKKFIQQKFGLKEDPEVPIICMITRLTSQKGLELVRHVFHEIMEEDVQFLVLGTGDPEFENFFREMEYTYSDKCKAYIGFDENLAHQIYAGADLFLMPSKFEPCGLGQLIALRYGNIPIVRETGGLNDTVFSYNELTEEGNGFSFTNFNAHDMLFTIRRGIGFYKEDKEVWHKLMKNAMSMDNSWAQSAFKYNQLYAELISRSESHVF